MSAVPAEKYLVEFAADGEWAPQVANRLPKAVERGLEGPPAPDTARLSEEAFARGVESGKALARLMLDSQLTEEAAKWQSQLACERDRWMKDEAEKLREGMRTALGAIEQNIALATARILQPFLTAALHKQAVAELQATLQGMLNKGGELRVDIFGPQDLVQALAAGLDGKDAIVTCHEASDCELRVELGQTVLETRLGAWFGKIREATS
jgi:hypothetical protein